jgi:hypothetical protein
MKRDANSKIVKIEILKKALPRSPRDDVELAIGEP